LGDEPFEQAEGAIGRDLNGIVEIHGKISKELNNYCLVV
jgi:hypothetical protein